MFNTGRKWNIFGMDFSPEELANLFRFDKDGVKYYISFDAKDKSTTIKNVFKLLKRKDPQFYEHVNDGDVTGKIIEIQNDEFRLVDD